MLKWLLIILGVILAAGLITSFLVTRGGKLIVPKGEGTVTIGDKTFEAFTLPDYASAFVNDDYKSYFIEVERGIKLHVLEVGSGYPVYMQHGNPTNALLYRRVVELLPTDQVRLIMPTMVGLGFSSKVPAGEHTLENHMRWMNAALQQLDLDALIYVGQDWGGPVGMGALSQSPGLVQGVVALNTGFTAPTEPMDLSRAHALAKTPVVGEILLEQVVSIFDRLQETQGDPTSMPEQVRALYGRPVLESGNRKAPLALMRMVPDGPDHPSAEQMRTIEAYVNTLDVPAEIVWGRSDPIFGRALPVMQGFFPRAPVTETEAGHFLQEEVPEEIAAAITRVLKEVAHASAGGRGRERRRDLNVRISPINARPSAFRLASCC
ncbi:MAG: alpha/beta fold hydrolase [Gammaproteobacteria bacterium]|nr:alpha/beta fold hydrolase [Gammaproteobacteria bacterium]